MAGIYRLSVSETVGKAFGLLFRNPLLFLGTALIQVVFGALNALFGSHHRHAGFNAMPGGGFAAQSGQVTAGHLSPGMIATVCLLAVPIFLLALYLAFILVGVTAAATAALLRGEKPNLKEAYIRGATSAGRQVWPGVLVMLAAFLGALVGGFVIGFGAGIGVRFPFMVVGSVLLVAWVLAILIRYYLVFPAVFFEGVRGRSALARSAELVKGAGWHVFGTIVATWLLLVAVIVGLTVAGGILAVLIGGVGEPAHWVLALVQVAVNWFGQAGTIVLVILYMDLSDTAAAGTPSRTAWLPATS